jgi:endoglucanase
MLCAECLLQPSTFLAGGSFVAMLKLSGISLTALVISLGCIYLLLLKILGYNHGLANLKGYPSRKDIAAKLPSASNITAPLFKPPLHTQGRYILDDSGARFKLASINWYGASDELFIPGGLDVQHRQDIAATIRRLGFNSVRLPYADEMVRKNPPIAPDLLAANTDLVGSRALDVFHAVVDALTDAGLAVIINNHITRARWCCDGNLCDATWSNDYLGSLCTVSQTEDEWMENWETIMRPHVRNPFVVGADLRNEVRSPWGRFTWYTWATAAEKAAGRLLHLQPDWLIIVEGVQSANDVSGARLRPIELTVSNRLVYSAHVYGWSGWGSLSPYWKRSYESFATDMQNNWAYLLAENVAPVWIGEIGVPEVPNQGDLHYWKNLIRYLKECDADFGYWAINPRKTRENELETYALVEDDWKTLKYDYRIHDLATLAGNSAKGSQTRLVTQGGA